jgi:glycosyltransferase involved in cell wall biosynthesis
MIPKISVIVPVYNVEKYIHHCIDSILKQSFKDFECILVDDHSPDGCPRICDEYGEKDNRIQVIHNKQNQGSPQARKTGLEASKGMFILFIDSDDWIEHDMLEKMYDKAISGNYDMVRSNCFSNLAKYQLDDKTPELYDKTLIYKHIIMYWRYSASVWDKLVKREIYEKVIFPVHHYIDDRVITIQTIYYATHIGYVPDCLYHYRKQTESICNSQMRADKAVDEYHNFNMILDFLKSKELSSGLEREIRHRINSIKLSFLMEKKLRDNSNIILDNFCPDSTVNIFKGNIYMNFFNKTILSLALKKNPLVFIIIDIYLLFRFVVKKVYKSLIPSKIRLMIMLKRQTLNSNKQI